MPLYEYTCSSCALRFEKLVRASTVPACPTCNTEDVQRVISGFAVGRGNSRMSGGSMSASPPPKASGGGGCGTCGDPRGPGSCASD